jgi:N-acetylglutamate synthase-like GNAT family acetyltransferase
MPSSQFEIVQATDGDLGEIRALLRAYAESLGYRACFHEFERELDSLPGPYGPPSGRLLVARAEGAVVGLVGIAPAAEGICEMRRLVVRNDYRGRGAGRGLADAALAAAAAIGYRRMTLETLDEMVAARTLYLSLGFVAVIPDRARAGIWEMERALVRLESTMTA